MKRRAADAVILGQLFTGTAVRGPRRILLRIASVAAISTAILFGVVLWVLPLLGRHGDLNAVVEGIIRSALSVPVEIERVETDALSEFSITRVSSLQAEAAERFQFRADRLTAFYRPLELILARRVRELMAERPSLFLDLDRDLSGIVPRSSGPADFQLDRFRIADGRLRVRLGGRDLALEGLDLDAAGLGRGGNLFFELEGRFVRARIFARGELERLPGTPGSPSRYRLEAAQLAVEELSVGAVLGLLAPVALEAGGRMSLSGTARGVWPEKVEVQLSSRVREASATTPKAIHLEDGEGSLEVSATILGELDRVELHVELQAEGDVGPPPTRVPGEGPAPARRERLSITLGGEFEKKAPDGERVRIKEARLSLGALGEIEAKGTLALWGEEPSFDLSFRWPLLPLGRLRSYPLLPIQKLALNLDGDLELEGRVQGLYRRPEVEVNFALRRGRFHVAERLLLEAAARGSARLTYPEGSRRIDFRIAEGSLEASAAGLTVPALKAHGSARLETEPSGALSVRLDAALLAEEIGIGRVVETPGKDPIAIACEAVIPPGLGGPGDPPVTIDSRIDTPSFGPVSLRGKVTGASRGPWSLDLEAPSIPSARFLGTYLRDPFQARFSILEGAQFSGKSSLEARLLRAEEGLRVEGRFHTGDLGAQLAGVQVSGVSLDIPFRLGGPAYQGGVPGSVEIGRLESRGLELQGLKLPFTLEDGAYRLQGKAVLAPVFGGVIDLERLELRPLERVGERLQLELHAREIDLSTLTPLLGWPPIPGRAQLEVDDLAFSDRRLLIDGRLVLEVFGGRLELGGLSIEHPGTAYQVYRLARGEAREIDLRRLGEAFRFGLASGILEGWIRNLVTTGSEVVGFEAEFETVRRSGVSQYINKAAIESIRRVLAGPFGALEKLFASKFKYAGFGFYCRLKDGRFRLRGKYNFGGVEYIMHSRWYQFPRVDIINTRPNIDYDWEAIFENLKAIYRGPEARRPAGSTNGE